MTVIKLRFLQDCQIILWGLCLGNTGMDTGKNTETVSILYDAMRPGGRMDLFVLL